MAREIFVVGTSQTVASASVRERLHVDLGDVYATLGQLLCDRDVLEEAIPLATCGRLEVYSVAQDPARATRLLLRLLGRHTGVPGSKLEAHTYTLKGPTAVRHLLRVASGLDSVVHGEAQILGQVREAAGDPRSKETKGAVLHRLFDTALATGKKVRTETEIGRGAASLAGAALQMVQREIGSLESRTALVVGAGDTGALVARLLRKAGVGRLIVANRTVGTASEVASALGAEAIALDDIPGSLPTVDLAVGAITAEDFVITPEVFAAVPPRPSGDPRYLLDLAHPRNFDPAVREVPGVELFDLDHVFERVEAAKASRATQVPMAEAIVKDQAAGFERWLRSRQMVGVLRAVREHVLDLAQSEAERLGNGRPEVEREELRLLARSVARTLLHSPTVALRTADPDSPEGRSLLEAATTLFGAEPQAPTSTRSP